LDRGIWDRYWRFDRIASCFDGAGAFNYHEAIAGGWRAFFGGLGDGAGIIDLCTGNGAVALLAAEDARFRQIVAVDQADIDPPTFVTRHRALLSRIAFHGKTPVEALPFADSSFDAAVSQFGLEYANVSRAVPELVRVLAPGARIRLVVHAADGRVAADARASCAEVDLLLDEIDLPGAAARCYEAVAGVERDGRDEARADPAFAAFREALRRAAERVPRAHDPAMIRNIGRVLLDTHRKRGALSLDQLLAKAEEARTELSVHRARLEALLEAAVDEEGAIALAAMLRRAGSDEAKTERLADPQGLIGYVIEARIPG
jgi:SAM-dependent methyltransferase